MRRERVQGCVPRAFHRGSTKLNFPFVGLRIFALISIPRRSQKKETIGNVQWNSSRRRTVLCSFILDGWIVYTRNLRTLFARGDYIRNVIGVIVGTLTFLADEYARCRWQRSPINVLQTVQHCSSIAKSSHERIYSSSKIRSSRGIRVKYRINILLCIYYQHVK